MKTNLKSIIIFRPDQTGKMYLCRDGTLSSCREDAAEHWGFQFRHVVKDSPIVNSPNRARAEIVDRR
jgi:hypothetical protein